MPSRAYLGDVAQVTRGLLSEGFARGIIDRSERAAEQLAGVEFEVFVRGAALRPALAALEALQLAVDAASVAVQYTDSDAAGSISAPTTGLLGEFAAAWLPLYELEIIDLDRGSLRARLRLNPRSPEGRRRLVAVGTLASLALFPILGPIPGMVVAGVGALNELVTSDRPTGPIGQISTIDRAEIAAAEEVRITIEEQRAA
jgi:hypothetical protein